MLGSYKNIGLSLTLLLAMPVGSNAVTLIDEDFETPDIADNTASPGYSGWTWVGGNIRSQDSSGDGVPGTVGQQVIQFEWTGQDARYDLNDRWNAGETYVVTLNASPQSWSGQTTREIVVNINEDDGTELWTSGSVTLPLYDGFGGNAWGARQTFSFTVDSDDFSGGTANSKLQLEITSTGSRGLFFDNVSLVEGALGTDSTAPTPNAMTWVSVPAIENNTNITMTCTFASDDFPYGVQHYFENTNTGVNSGWQDGVNGWTWTEYDLAPDSTNSYRCKARDLSPGLNETAWSSILTVVMPPADALPPNPDPMTWVTVPVVVDTLNIYMKATTAVDAEYGVEYYFENKTTAVNSGWQTATTWYQLCQDYDTPFTYRVKSRDISPGRNESAWSSEEVVTVSTPATADLEIEAVFDDPLFSNATWNPGFVGWTHNGKSYRSDSNSEVPADDYPTTVNQVAHFEQTSYELVYDLCRPWSVNEIYVLTVNASPVSWNGSNARYIAPSLLQQDNTVLWSSNDLMPVWNASFGRTPWTADRTFEYSIRAEDFATGTAGSLLRLKIKQTGTRGIYVDNVTLRVEFLTAEGTLFSLR